MKILKVLSLVLTVAGALTVVASSFGDHMTQVKVLGGLAVGFGWAFTATLENMELRAKLKEYRCFSLAISHQPAM
jgi:drug/metabolite transporter (DMT)-like permease